MCLGHENDFDTTGTGGRTTRSELYFAVRTRGEMSRLWIMEESGTGKRYTALICFCLVRKKNWDCANTKAFEKAVEGLIFGTLWGILFRTTFEIRTSTHRVWKPARLPVALLRCELYRGQEEGLWRFRTVSSSPARSTSHGLHFGSTDTSLMVACRFPRSFESGPIWQNPPSEIPVVPSIFLISDPQSLEAHSFSQCEQRHDLC